MSSGFLGADVAALRALAEKMQADADTLTTVRSEVQSRLATTNWVGPDGEAFRAQWDGLGQPTLTSTSALLATGARTLLANADAQEVTSTDFAGPGSPNGPSGPGRPDGPSGPGGNPTGGRPPEWMVPDAGTNTRMTEGSVANWILGQGVDLWETAARLDDPLDIASLGSRLGTAGKVLGAAGVVFDGYAVYSGAMQAWEGFSEGDAYKGTDGVITAGLGAAGIGAAIFLASNPVGWAIAGAGAVWGVATLLSGDVPVTQRIADVAGWVWDRGADAVDAIGDGLSNVVEATGDFIEGAGETLRNLWPF